MAMRYDNNSLGELYGKSFFLDTNVLLDLFYTHKTDWSAVAYSKLFKGMVARKMHIFIDNTVLSEFINRILRIEYKLSGAMGGKTPATFKTYRNTDEGLEKVREAYDLVNVILKVVQLDGEVLNSDDIQTLLVVDDIDYNDKTIEHLCVKKGYVLVTNDIDFADSEADIISANHALYSSLRATE